jgi:hypothetical protein
MNYHDAKKSIFRGRIWGGALTTLASLTCIISILKFLYYGFDAGSTLSHGVDILLRQLVADIYRHTHFLGFFWEYAPLPDARHWLSESNVLFALSYVIAVIGVMRCHYANTLAQRVQEVEKVLAEVFHLHPIAK